jgi:hypothetical protein
MGIMNKRNALLGWTVWKLGKRVVKKKAKAAMPIAGGESGGRTAKLAILAALAAVGGALLLWRRTSGGVDEQFE